MPTYRLIDYLPRGEPTPQWATRAVNRMQRCKEAMQKEGANKEEYKKELQIWQKAIRATEIKDADLKALHTQYTNIRRMKREAVQKAMQEALQNFDG